MTFSESRKRLGSPENDESPKIKRRGTGSETIAFLQAKAEKDSDLRAQELGLRKLETEQRYKAAEAQQKLLVDMLDSQKQQMHDVIKRQEDMQKQQQALLLANIQAQQQQMQLFMTMIEKIKKD